MKKLFLLSVSVIAFAVLAIAILLAPHPVSAKSPQPSSPADAPSPQGGAIIFCGSDNGRRNFCPADTRGGVRLVNQRSNSPCVFQRTWGFDARNIWTDRGCRADFQANYYGPGIPSFPGYPPGGGGSYIIYCSSDSGGRVFCPTDVSGGVSLARQRSKQRFFALSHRLQPRVSRRASPIKSVLDEPAGQSITLFRDAQLCEAITGPSDVIAWP